VIGEADQTVGYQAGQCRPRGELKLAAERAQEVDEGIHTDRAVPDDNPVTFWCRTGGNAAGGTRTGHRPLQEGLESNGGHAIEITCSRRPGRMPPVTGYLFGSRRSVAGGRAGMRITMPTRIGRDELRELTGQGAQLAEVLPADDYDWAHLPGAVNLPLKQLDVRAGQLERSRPVIVYCHDGL
jgi:hypothetical protein